MSLSPDQALDALRRRYATKLFDPSRSIPPESWEALLETLVLTPSSFGLQPWKFLVIRHPEIRQQLRAESWNQSQVTDASHFVVFTARTDVAAEDISALIARTAELRNVAPESLAPYQNVIAGFAEQLTPEARRAWNERQIYIALGQFMTTAAFLGIDTCPMEGLSTAAYDRILGLEGTGYATRVACAVGYRSAEDPYALAPKVRFERSRIIEER